MVFLKKLQELHSDLKNSLWFADEVGFEGDPRPRHAWVKKGSKPKAPYFGDSIRYNAVGSVNPKSGGFFSLVVPHLDKEVFQVFLDEFAKHTTTNSKQAIFVPDNASWYKYSDLKSHRSFLLTIYGNKSFSGHSTSRCRSVFGSTLFVFSPGAIAIFVIGGNDIIYESGSCCFKY